jgi:hypothetical protein
MKKIMFLLVSTWVLCLALVTPVMAAPSSNPSSVVISRYAVTHNATSGITSYRVKLSTAYVSGAYGYAYQYSLDNGLTWKTIVNSSARTIYSSYIMVDGQTHLFRVRAYDSSRRTNIVDRPDPNNPGKFLNIKEFKLTQQVLEPKFKTYGIEIPTILKFMSGVATNSTPLVGFMIYNEGTTNIVVNRSVVDKVYQAGNFADYQSLSLHSIDFKSLITLGRLYIKPAASVTIAPYEYAPVIFFLSDYSKVLFDTNTEVKFSFTYDSHNYETTYTSGEDYYYGQFYSRLKP